MRKEAGVLSKKERQLLDALTSRALDEGIEIVTVEIVGAKKAPTIRVYIDTFEGVSFDELSATQVWINEIMDKLDPFPGAYTLEVSSPGIDRPLRTPEHFARFVGDTAVVKTKSPVDGKSTFTGRIVAVDAPGVELEVDEAMVVIPFDIIKRAHLKGAIDFSS